MGRGRINNTRKGQQDGEKKNAGGEEGCIT